MKKFALAAKSLVIYNNSVLLVKRTNDNPQAPGIWELPGGRLELGEDPFEGLKREIREETNIEVDILYPLTVRHFTRKDNLIVTLIIFLSKAKSSDIKLSYEHEAFAWEPLATVKEKLNPWFHEEVDAFNKLQLEKHL